MAPRNVPFRLLIQAYLYKGSTTDNYRQFSKREVEWRNEDAGAVDDSN
jgi:hypothetical protein